MGNLIKKNTSFFIPYSFFVLSILLLISLYSKYESQILANQYHHISSDYFFYYATQLVETIGIIFILISISVIKNFKYFFIAIIAYLFTGLITQILKNTLYLEVMRPSAVMENLRLLPDYFQYHQNSAKSFPSGHSTSAFSIFFYLTLISKNKKWGYFFGIAAILVAYSRVYLSQHFFEDILAGSLIGTFGTLFCFFVLDRFSFGKWASKNWGTLFKTKK